MDTVWQYRVHYGVTWGEWQDITEGVAYLGSPVDFRKKPQPADCSISHCDAVAEYDGLCAWHGQEAEEYDPWAELEYRNIYDY